MYKAANVKYAKKLYGESVVVRAIQYIESEGIMRISALK